MNYPIWELPAPGLLIAAVAILHVFVSHFAIGGGLFLVRFEKLARDNSNPELLDYVKVHSRFFVLTTLVLGAVSGVGIWFTIGLIHPSGTSMLIQGFVWAWAIEWTFFATEIAAAMVYYYGWNKLSPRLHLAVGWIYFISAWMSLFVINGILTFMLTPGEWLQSGSLVSGFFNPTFWPSLISRTLICFGLAGLYALVTISFYPAGATKSLVSRRAVYEWIVPAGIFLPASLFWYLGSAAKAGVPVVEILGATGNSLSAILQAVFSAPAESGYPNAQIPVLIMLIASVAIILLALVFGTGRKPELKPPVSILILILGLVAFGGIEFIRENLRKPFVLGNTMFVNSVRIPVPATVEGVNRQMGGKDRFEFKNVQQKGLIESALWNRELPADHDDLNQQLKIREGTEVFRLACSSCHTLNGHLGIRPQVAGKSYSSIYRIIDRLAVPVNDQREKVNWSENYARIETWRGRRMPPFAGSEREKESLAQFLTRLGGGSMSSTEFTGGKALFEENCIFCHAPEADWPMPDLVGDRNSDQLFEIIGKLPELNPIMPPFEGTDEQRRELAEYLASINQGD